MAVMLSALRTGRADNLPPPSSEVKNGRFLSRLLHTFSRHSAQLRKRYIYVLFRAATVYL
jgi:hypothetical protein